MSYARAGYLPDLSISAELERGTGNVLRGSLFAMPNIPPVSGPPTGRGLDRGAWGSAAGIGVSWDALGLVKQMGVVDAALAEASATDAATAVARLIVGFSAAEGFIEVASGEEAMRAARATRERAQSLATTVHALAAQELRPGAEEARANAELALASTQLIRAEQAVRVGKAELARRLGIAGQRIDIEIGNLAEAPRTLTSQPLSPNPLLLEADARIQVSESRRRAAELQYLPRLDIVGALWTRGTGLESGGLGASPSNGLWPDTPNWAAAVVLSWPVLGTIAVRARARVEAAQTGVEVARRADTEQAVAAQVDTARALLDAAREVAANTPIALAAARASEAQATARYRAGLSTIVDVAEAQRVLAQAEIEDAVARLDIRRAMLLLARAMGDIEPFLTSLGPEGG